MASGTTLCSCSGPDFEEAADIARGLADALLVLHQRDAHEALAVFAEADAGRDGEIGLFHQQRGKLDAAEALERLRDRRPGEHRGAWARHVETGAAEALHQHVAAALINLAHFLDAIVGPVERGDRRHLDRREGAVIEIGLHAAERGDHPLVADGEADAPARHRVRLRHRGELDRDIDRARHLQQRGRRIVVEIDFRVGEIGQHQDVVLLGESDEVLVEIEACHIGGRIGRIADHHRGRLRDRVDDRAFQRVEEIRRRLRRHRAHGAARHQEAEGVDRIARIGNEHDIARRGDRLRHVGEAFLGAERRDDLGLRVQLHPKTALVIFCLREAKLGNAARGRITVGSRLAQRLLDLLDDMGRRGQIRIAHAEIDDVGSRIAGARLGPVHLFEHVRRQAADAVKVFHCLKPLGRLPCPAGRYDPGRLLSWVGLCAILGGGVCVFLGGGLLFLLRLLPALRRPFLGFPADRARPSRSFSSFTCCSSVIGAVLARRRHIVHRGIDVRRGRPLRASRPVSHVARQLVDHRPRRAAAKRAPPSPKAAKTDRTKARAIPRNTCPWDGKSMQTQ